MASGFFMGVTIVDGVTSKQGDLITRTDLYFICRIGPEGSSWDEKGLEFRSNVIKGQRVTWNARFCFYQKWKQETPLEMTINLMDRDTFTEDDFLDGVTIKVPQIVLDDWKIEVPQIDIHKSIPAAQFSEKAAELTIQFNVIGDNKINCENCKLTKGSNANY